MKFILPLLLIALLATGCPTPRPDPLPTPEPTSSPLPAPSPRPAPPGAIYGVTIDDVSNLKPVLASLSLLRQKPMVRVVFDEGTSPSDYVGAIGILRDNGYLILGELTDSLYLKQLSVAQYAQRAKDFMNTFQSSVTIWEIGNEVGGSWLGTQVGEKISAAYDYAKLRGLKTALTGYYCVDSGSLIGWLSDPINVPERMRTGLDYFLVSHYERDCDRPAGQISAATWTGFFNQAGALFVNAKVGFGETGIGMVSEKDSSEYGSGAEKGAYLTRYYTMDITSPRYILGGFWWWGRQDLIPAHTPVWEALQGVMP